MSVTLVKSSGPRSSSEALIIGPIVILVVVRVSVLQSLLSLVSKTVYAIQAFRPEFCSYLSPPVRATYSSHLIDLDLCTDNI